MRVQVSPGAFSQCVGIRNTRLIQNQLLKSMQVQILSLRFLSNIKEEYSFLYRKRDDTSPCRLRTRLRASSRPSMNSIFFVKKIRIKLLFSEKIRHIKNNRWNTGACLCNIGRKKDGLRPEAPTSARASGGEFTDIIYYIKQPENKIWLFLCSWNFFLQKYLKYPQKFFLM